MVSGQFPSLLWLSLPPLSLPVQLLVQGLLPAGNMPGQAKIRVLQCLLHMPHVAAGPPAVAPCLGLRSTFRSAHATLDLGHVQQTL